MKKTAVLLFNLGGPDKQSSVRPFLYRLFSDKAIIRLPWGLRHILAGLISWISSFRSKKNYGAIGGGSPLLKNTEAQRAALELALKESSVGSDTSEKEDYRVFIGMRYWHPFIQNTLKEIREWGPDRVVLLPLYPQYSTTTTGSSFGEFLKRWPLKNIPLWPICCYPAGGGFPESVRGILQKALDQWPSDIPCRILFSAHGLPEDIVKNGDPYPQQVAQSVEAVMKNFPGRDFLICYQSRVGPKKWLEPSTESEIIRAGKENMGLLIVPIAFVSEHIETLFELDQEYHEVAQEAGVPHYLRVPTVGTDDVFIDGLATLVKRQLSQPPCPQCTCPAKADSSFFKGTMPQQRVP